MEFVPKPPSPEGEPDDDDEKDGKKKKPSFRAPLPISETSGAETEKPRTPKGIGDALFEGLGKKPQADKVGEASEAKQGKDEPSAESTSTETATQELPSAVGEGGEPSESVEAAPDVDLHTQAEPFEVETEAEDAYEALPSQELPLDSLGGGEVVVHLNGPVGEHVIPLQSEAAPETPASEGDPEGDAQNGAEATTAEDPLEPPEVAAATPSGAEAYQNPWFTPARGTGNTPPPPRRPTPPPTPAAPVQPVIPPVRHTPAPLWPGAVPPSPFNQANYPNYPNATPYVQPGEQAATKKEVEDAVRQAKARGLGQGLATGLLVGGTYEHFKHKRREKKREKQIAVHQKQLAEARKAYAVELEAREAERLQQAQQAAAMQERVQGLENRGHAQIAAAEKPPVTPVTAVEVPEQLVVPADHRIETSAWHTIEVDAKTGKAVENPTFQYGKEYYHERAQEMAPITQHASAAGEIALVAAAAQSAASGQGSGADSPVVPNASQRTSLPFGAPSGQGATGQGAKRGQPGSGQGMSGGPLWVWLIALGVLIVCIIAAL